MESTHHAPNNKLWRINDNFGAEPSTTGIVLGEPGQDQLADRRVNLAAAAQEFPPDQVRREGAARHQHRGEIGGGILVARLYDLMQKPLIRSPSQGAFLARFVIAKLESMEPAIRLRPDNQIEIIVEQPAPGVGRPAPACMAVRLARRCIHPGEFIEPKAQ